MNRLIRFYNQNRKKFWTIVIVILFIFLIIRILNYAAKIQNKQKLNVTDEIETNKSVYEPNKSAISEVVIDKNVYSSQNSLVSNFVNYCNDGEVQKAYDLLSSECKEELYPNVQSFKQKYYDSIFNIKRTYSIKNWSDSIYIVRYTEDMLSTGKVKSDSTFQDYIKIVNGGRSLNISGFLGKEILNFDYQGNGVNIRVLEKTSYMDYELYTFEVQNSTGENIVLDNLSSNKTIYLTDKNNVKHYAIGNELTIDSLTVKDKYKKQISIKFDNPYIEGRVIKQITFSSVAVGFDENKNEDYKGIISCSIDI